MEWSNYVLNFTVYSTQNKLLNFLQRFKCKENNKGKSNASLSDYSKANLILIIGTFRHSQKRNLEFEKTKIELIFTVCYFELDQLDHNNEVD